MRQHSLDDWLAALPDLRKTGSEYRGPCPVCGGVSGKADRFRVLPSGMAYCRQCCDSTKKPEAYRAIVEAVFGQGDRQAGSATPRAWPKRLVQARPTAPTPAPNPPRQYTPAMAEACYRLAVPITRTPAEVYLTCRGVWPVPGLDPASHHAPRWLPREHAHALRLGLPDAAAGCLLFPCIHAVSGELHSLQAEALTNDGQRLAERWRRSRGSMAGSVFMASWPPMFEWLVITEGPVDALACAGHYHDEPATVAVVAAGSTAGMSAAGKWIAELPAGVSIIIKADSEAPGQQAAQQLLATLRNTNRQAEAHYSPAGTDPADTHSLRANFHEGLANEIR